jgi:hypothetical protein
LFDSFDYQFILIYLNNRVLYVILIFIQDVNIYSKFVIAT